MQSANSTTSVSVNDLGLDPDLQVKVAPILSSVRHKCLRMGQNGLDLLRRKVNARDNRIQVRADPDDFRLSLLDLGVVLTSQELKYLTLAFKDVHGYLRVNLLCDHICGVLSEERAALVDGIFDILDVDGSGTLEIDDLRAVSNFERHPDVMSGKLTVPQAMRQYLDVFDSEDSDGKVTRDEFHAYYAGVSENCPTLEYFEEVLRSAWKMLDLEQLSSRKTAKAPSPREEAGCTVGLSGTTNTVLPTRNAGPLTGTSTFGVSHVPPAAELPPNKRIVGYTGHVPLAKERFGETFYRIDAETPDLPAAASKRETVYYGKPYVDTKNAFVRQGNKSNTHSFKMA